MSIQSDHAGVPSADPLITVLADVLDQVDGPSASLVDRAASLFALRRLDAESMELLTDSLTLASSHRAEQLDLRFLTFHGSECTLQIEVVPVKGGHEFVGNVTPAGSHRVELADSTTAAATVTDEYGRFRLACPGGTVRLLVVLADGRRQITPGFDV